MFGPPLLANALGSAMVIWQITKNNGGDKGDITRVVKELKMGIALIEKRVDLINMKVNMTNDNMPMVTPEAMVVMGTRNDLGICEIRSGTKFCQLSRGEDC
ncbi:hypothetical protein L873DRAFT_1801500 [Choiromyces venosus 120613-1]|uniref:Uncharacterized protein n=1 Tax=Choiromyces venosus 120613-1 TaxID=1336337 RepID=A0A3N4K0R9_9PEZI|nr:hypothetical protein L873DRAFT_1801500 [Choiromyces venosus 120613-1]